MSPLEGLAGYKGRTFAESKILTEVKDTLDQIDLRLLLSKISKIITEDQKIQKQRFDKTRTEANQYQEGEIVMVLITDRPCTGRS